MSKVHKIENFVDSDFGICVRYVKILRFYKKFFDWAIIGGGTIFPRSPRTTQNEKKFGARSQKFFSSSSLLDPKY
jgi:hypothetical protein